MSKALNPSTRGGQARAACTVALMRGLGLPPPAAGGGGVAVAAPGPGPGDGDGWSLWSTDGAFVSWAGWELDALASYACRLARYVDLFESPPLGRGGAAGLRPPRPDAYRLHFPPVREPTFEERQASWCGGWGVSE